MIERPGPEYSGYTTFSPYMDQQDAMIERLREEVVRLREDSQKSTDWIVERRIEDGR